MPSEWEFFQVVIAAGNFMLGIAVLLAGIRLIKGPKTIDRIVALDLMAGIAIGFSVLLAIQHNDSSYLNIALCLAVIVFIGTVALTLYLEKASNDN